MSATSTPTRPSLIKIDFLGQLSNAIAEKKAELKEAARRVREAKLKVDKAAEGKDDEAAPADQAREAAVKELTELQQATTLKVDLRFEGGALKGEVDFNWVTAASGAAAGAQAAKINIKVDNTEILDKANEANAHYNDAHATKFELKLDADQLAELAEMAVEASKKALQNMLSKQLEAQEAAYQAAASAERLDKVKNIETVARRLRIARNNTGEYISKIAKVKPPRSGWRPAFINFKALSSREKQKVKSYLDAPIRGFLLPTLALSNRTLAVQFQDEERQLSGDQDGTLTVSDAAGSTAAAAADQPPKNFSFKVKMGYTDWEPTLLGRTESLRREKNRYAVRGVILCLEQVYAQSVPNADLSDMTLKGSGYGVTAAALKLAFRRLGPGEEMTVNQYTYRCVLPRHLEVLADGLLFNAAKEAASTGLSKGASPTAKFNKSMEELSAHYTAAMTDPALNEKRTRWIGRKGHAIDQDEARKVYRKTALRLAVEYGVSMDEVRAATANHWGTDEEACALHDAGQLSVEGAYSLAVAADIRDVVDTTPAGRRCATPAAEQLDIAQAIAVTCEVLEQPEDWARRIIETPPRARAVNIAASALKEATDKKAAIVAICLNNSVAKAINHCGGIDDATKKLEMVKAIVAGKGGITTAGHVEAIEVVAQHPGHTAAQMAKAVQDICGMDDPEKLTALAIVGARLRPGEIGMLAAASAAQSAAMKAVAAKGEAYKPGDIEKIHQLDAGAGASVAKLTAIVEAAKSPNVEQDYVAKICKIDDIEKLTVIAQAGATLHAGDIDELISIEDAEDVRPRSRRPPTAPIVEAGASTSQPAAGAAAADHRGAQQAAGMNDVSATSSEVSVRRMLTQSGRPPEAASTPN